jgi:arylsulfatase A-like enzyme
MGFSASRVALLAGEVDDFAWRRLYRPRTMRRIILCLLLVAWLAIGHAAERPHIVVFLSDDHTLRDCSVYGAKGIATPNLQRLADAGMTFENAFVVSPSCAPSRAALLTGLLPQHNGAEANHAAPRADLKKLPAYFQELGYQVVAFGKVGHYAQTKDYGFDLARHFTYHEDVAVGEAVKWLATRKSAKPLALFVGTNWPHVPWPAETPGSDATKLEVPPNHVDTPATREWRARYVAAVQTMDRELGLVLDAVRRELGDNTLFLHTSDHGAQWPFAKWTLYDDGLRTPLIISWPGKIAPGRRTAAMVSWLDILPTLIEVADGTVPEGLDGRSFLPVLFGKTTNHRDRTFATHSGDGANNVYPSRALRTLDGWKYIRNLHPEFRFTTHITTGGGDSGYWASWVKAAATDATASMLVKRYMERPAEELYRVTDDPFEQQNLAAEPAHAERLAAMRAELDEWMRATGDAQKVFGPPNLLSEPERKTLPKNQAQ